MKAALGVLLFCAAGATLACDYPDEGTMPLHRAVKKVELVPEIDDWARRTRDSGAIVQFTVKLDAPVRAGRRCYWTVDVAAGGNLWNRFYVTPDGRDVRADDGSGKPVPLANWRAGRK